MIEAILGQQFPQKVIPLIDSAVFSIRIVVFDWRWYPNDPGNPVSLFNQAIVRAARRGVKVQVVANNDEVVKILKEQGVEARRIVLKDIVHAKLMIIDDKIIVIGSHNYTQNAFCKNHEISTIIYDAAQAPEFLKFFNSIWQL
jgi:phosphatidylserine/phosphatidylglycerophosphate/cardiolipin synthase-like enzyme